MKKYLVFTKDNLDAYYHVFQGDYDKLSQAFRKIWGIAQNSGKLCVYKIVSHVSMRCEAEGFVNPVTLQDLSRPRAEEHPSTIALRSGYKQVAKCEV